ncbi:MAG: ZIP family metal transporter [Vicingaceae bacterium]
MMTYLPFIGLFLATFLIGAIALAVQHRHQQSIKLFLSFSGAFLLATCVIHLLPELFQRGDLNVAPFILLGFFFQILIEFISQGVEHGHIHAPKKAGTFPGLIFLGLCLHAFTEGLPLSNIDQGAAYQPLYWGILMHKLPIALVLVSLFAAHDLGKRTSLTALAIFALLTPLGGMTGHALAQTTGITLIPYFLAASTGIFLHISTVILFETSHNHRFNLLKFLFITAGGLLAYGLF